MQFIHWLEVYDLKGELVSTEKLIKAGNSKGDWLEFVGTTSNDNVVFSRGDRLLVFEVPSLQIVADNYLGKRLPFSREMKYSKRRKMLCLLNTLPGLGLES